MNAERIIEPLLLENEQSASALIAREIELYVDGSDSAPALTYDAQRHG